MSSAQNPVPFLPPEPERTLSARTWAIAAIAVLLLAGIAAVATISRSPANTGAVQTPDTEAGKLPLSDVSLSEATNGAGGKSTYVDGTITNNSNGTLTGAVVQVTFAAADGSAPHRETLPLSLIRTRVPYVDLQPVSADPIAPQQHREFRLIFESVPDTWDVKPPSIQVVHTDWK